MYLIIPAYRMYFINGLTICKMKGFDDGMDSLRQATAFVTGSCLVKKEPGLYWFRYCNQLVAVEVVCAPYKDAA